jgi:hypothetical protein
MLTGRGIQANMSIVDNIRSSCFSCISDVVESYGIALMQLAALMKRYGCSGLRTVVCSALFSWKSGLKQVYQLRTSFFFHVYLTYTTQNFVSRVAQSVQCLATDWTTR